MPEEAPQGLWLEQDDFSGGVFLDGPPNDAPSNCVLKADEALFDRGFGYRKRGCFGGSGAIAGTARIHNLLYYKSGNYDAREVLLGSVNDPSNDSTVSSPRVFDIYTIDQSSYAHTSLGLTSKADFVKASKPFQYLDFGFFPLFFTSTFRGMFIYGGAIVQHADLTQATIGTVAFTGNNANIAFATGSASIAVGDIVYAFNTANTHSYFGRIVTRTSNTVFSVWPKPDSTFTGNTVTVSNASQPVTNAATNLRVEPKYALAYQNRIIGANLGEYDPNVSNYTLWPNRIRWTTLPTETLGTVGTFTNVEGFKFGYMASWFEDNFLEIPGPEPITGIAKIGENQLMVFFQTQANRISGDLQDQSESSGGVASFSDTRIPYSFGLVQPLGDRSIQYSKRGVIFASPDGVMIYDGAQFTRLMRGTIERYWRKVIDDPAFAVAGSAMLDEKHYLVTVKGAAAQSIVINIDTGACSLWNSPSGLIWDSARSVKSGDESHVYGIKYYTGTPASVAGAIPLLSDSVGYPLRNTATTDNDGSTPGFSVVTRPLTLDEYTPFLVRDIQIVYYLYNVTTTSGFTLRYLKGNIDPSLGATPVLVEQVTTESTPGERTRYMNSLRAQDYAIEVMIDNNGGWSQHYLEVDRIRVRVLAMNPIRSSGVL